jgi:hypothetical protein
MIVFNYGLHQTRRITIEAPGFNTNSNVNLWRLVSLGPGSNRTTSFRQMLRCAPSASGVELWKLGHAPWQYSNGRSETHSHSSNQTKLLIYEGSSSFCVP